MVSFREVECIVIVYLMVMDEGINKRIIESMVCMEIICNIWWRNDYVVGIV